MAFEKIAEKKIRDAIQAGEFDDLPNAGDRLDFDAYFSLPPHLRMAYSVLKSANCLPAEVELLNDVRRLEGELAACSSADSRASLEPRLRDARLKLALAMERLQRDARRR